MPYKVFGDEDNLQSFGKSKHYFWELAKAHCLDKIVYSIYVHDLRTYEQMLVVIEKEYPDKE